MFNADGLAKRGLLVRLLVMPGHVEDGKKILDWIRHEISPDCYVHIMEQYRPTHLVGKGELWARKGFKGVMKYEEIDRPATREEVGELRQYAASIGLWRFEEPPRYEQA